MVKKLFSGRPALLGTLIVGLAAGAWLLRTEPLPAEGPAKHPDAGPHNTFFAPVQSAADSAPVQATEPAVPPATGPARPAASKVPAWLWGVPEDSRHPRAVYEAWRAWAATQGPGEEAARELVAYAKAHPTRRSHGEEKSVDEWMDVLSATNDPRLVQATLSQGYVASLLAAQDDGKEDAWRDLRAFMQCSLELCTQLRALHAMSDGLGRAALAWASDAASRCGVSVLGSSVTRGLAMEVDAQLAARGHRDTSGAVVSPQFLSGGAGSMPCETLAARIATGS